VDRVIVQRIPLNNVQFTDSGMFVRSGIPVETAYGEHRDNGKGWFVQVDRFAWVDRRTPSAEDAVERVDKQSVIETQSDRLDGPSTDIQAMDVDEVPAITKSEDNVVPNGVPDLGAPGEGVGEHKKDEASPPAFAEPARESKAEAPVSGNGTLSGNGQIADAAIAHDSAEASITPAMVEGTAAISTLPASVVGENAHGEVLKPIVAIEQETPTNGKGEVKDEPMEAMETSAPSDRDAASIRQVKAETALS
jgi:hypothetical protein